MGSVTSWFSETFNAQASESDLIAARSLNITRIGGVVVPVLTGVWTAISEVGDIPPFDDIGFQKNLILALVAFVGVLSVADMVSRAIAVRAASPTPGFVTFPSAIPATWTLDGPDMDGHVLAYRGVTGETSSLNEYLFKADDTSFVWVTADSVSFGG